MKDVIIFKMSKIMYFKKGVYNWLMNYALLYFLHVYEIINIQNIVMKKFSVSWNIKACRDIDFGHNPSIFSLKKTKYDKLQVC